MQLRSRKYGRPQGLVKTRRPRSKKPFHTSFTSFSKLPTEIRHMIWRFSLTPRTIEIEELRDRSSFYCVSQLPSAMSANRDSRNAVIGLYPYCFSSRSKAPAIRFNFSLDTLFLTSHFTQSIFYLLDILTHIELSNIRHVAIEEMCGWDSEDGYAQPIFWEHLETSMDAFSELEDLRIVLMSTPEDECDYLCEFFEEIPTQLVKDIKPEKYFPLVEDWAIPNIELVWGWRRAKYPRYI